MDMEPLEVLREFIEDPACDSISGPPQIVKIYPHARILPINVLWPPEYKRETREHGGQGRTNNAQELFEMVTKAVIRRQTA